MRPPPNKATSSSPLESRSSIDALSVSMRSSACSSPVLLLSALAGVFFGTSVLPNAPPAQAPAPAISAFPPVSAPVPPPAQPQQQLSFDDAFGAGPSRPAQDLAASTSTTSNGIVSGFSFDDAFGGNGDVLALDNSKSAQQPFPSSSPAGSPRGLSFDDVFGTSALPNATSPPRAFGSPAGRALLRWRLGGYCTVYTVQIGR